MRKSLPVMKAPSGLMRKAARFATSSGVPARERPRDLHHLDLVQQVELLHGLVEEEHRRLLRERQLVRVPRVPLAGIAREHSGPRSALPAHREGERHLQVSASVARHEQRE